MESSFVSARQAFSFSESFSSVTQSELHQRLHLHSHHHRSHKQQHKFLCVNNAPVSTPPAKGSATPARKTLAGRGRRDDLAGRQRGRGRQGAGERARPSTVKKSPQSPPPVLLPDPVGRRFAILKPRIDDEALIDKFLRGPLLTLKTLPLLSSCLPQKPFSAEDEEWMDAHIPKIKGLLGFSPDKLTAEDKLTESRPFVHLDTLLYLAFQHGESIRSVKAKYVRLAHSRLWFLGQQVVELALAEYFLLRYPREMPACIRERVAGLVHKKVLPNWIKVASLDDYMFSDQSIENVRSLERLQTIRGVFWALIGAVYLSMGMGEVNRILFEVFGFDPDDKSCLPKHRLGFEDSDYVYPVLDKKLSWQDLSKLKTEDDMLFAKPLLYRACVPSGMQRFRGNLWEIDSLPQVMQIMGYPLPSVGEDPSITSARNAELELGLQLCFLHPSKFKTEHPRFCNERLEYLGSKIQDVVMAEKLLMKYLDRPGAWLQERNRQLLYNKYCGKYLREKQLHKFIVVADSRVEVFERARRLRNFAATGVALAVHGLAYAVYGKAEVRRIMFDLFDYERLQSPY